MAKAKLSGFLSQTIKARKKELFEGYRNKLEFMLQQQCVLALLGPGTAGYEKGGAMEREAEDIVGREGRHRRARFQESRADRCEGAHGLHPGVTRRHP